MQTRLSSFLESMTNVGIGMIFALVGQVIVSWWYDLPLSIGQNMKIVLFFTVLSVIRTYAVRRWFNRRSVKWSRPT